MCLFVLYIHTIKIKGKGTWIISCELRNIEYIYLAIYEQAKKSFENKVPNTDCRGRDLMCVIGKKLPSTTIIESFL